MYVYICMDIILKGVGRLVIAHSSGVPNQTLLLRSIHHGAYYRVPLRLAGFFSTDFFETLADSKSPILLIFKSLCFNLTFERSFDHVCLCKDRQAGNSVSSGYFLFLYLPGDINCIQICSFFMYKDLKRLLNKKPM